MMTPETNKISHVNFFKCRRDIREIKRKKYTYKQAFASSEKIRNSVSFGK